jgi:hypothetical protein
MSNEQNTDEFLKAVADLCNRYDCRIKNGLIIANSYGMDIRAEFYFDHDADPKRVRVRVENEQWRYL